MSYRRIVIGAGLCAIALSTNGLAQQVVTANSHAATAAGPEARILSARVEATRSGSSLRPSAAAEFTLLGSPLSAESLLIAETAGSANALMLTQDGSDNEARLLQAGTENIMELRQTGDANDATLVQQGYGLRLGVEQTGGALIAITQINR